MLLLSPCSLCSPHMSPHVMPAAADAVRPYAVPHMQIHAHTCPRLLTLAVEANKRRLASASSGHTGAAGAPLEGADAALHACLNRINHLHQTPLMFAAYHGREEVLRLLMAAVGSEGAGNEGSGRSAGCMVGCGRIWGAASGGGGASMVLGSGQGRLCVVWRTSGCTPSHASATCNT